MCVQGELSGLTRHSSGHTYFSIKDDKAAIDGICWRGTPMPSQLKHGSMVVCHGKITTYGARSKYQMVIHKIDIAGQGALLEQIDALRKKLATEGLFDADRKKPIPRFPETIALITSPTGAVIQDMAIRFQDRMPCRLLLVPVNVQGPKTVPDIINALRTCYAHVPAIDLIIIARGGGSIEDLWHFNDETIVRAVAASPIPIISAIGHETDTTLIDYAADKRAPTPTAAAEMALPLVSTVHDTIVHHAGTLRKNARHYYDLAHARMLAAERSMTQWAVFFRPLEQKVDDMVACMTHRLGHQLTQSMHRMRLVEQRLHQTPYRDLTPMHHRVIHVYDTLCRHVKNYVHTAQSTADHLARLLEPLSYKKTLKRGFALVTTNGRPCTTVKQALQHKTLDVQLADGTVRTQPLDHQHDVDFFQNKLI